jgi:hypothetical protein
VITPGFPVLQGRITVLNEGLFKESSAAAGVACWLPEMEFLDILLTKDSSLFPYANSLSQTIFHSVF